MMRFLSSVFLALLLSCSITAQQPCQPASSQIFLDINNVKATILHGGNLWSNSDFTSPGYEVPKVDPPGSSAPIHSIFGGGLWIGGMDTGGNLKMAAQTYRQSGNDFWAGPLDATGQTQSTVCNEYDRFWKVQSSDIQQLIDYYNANGAPVPASYITQSIVEWPAKGNPNVRGAMGSSLQINFPLAPFIDVDNDGLYDPTQGDYPDVSGDQNIFWVFNDKGNMHSETGGQPLGIEVHANAYAFRSHDLLNDVTFYRFKIIYKSSTIINNAYVGIWADGDLGCFSNDYVACDTGRNMGVFYNGTTTDQDCASKGYGNDPPITGIKILKGPVADFANGKDDDKDGLIDEGGDGVDNDGDNLIDEEDEQERTALSAFVNYNGNSGSFMSQPSSANDFYGYLTGHWKNGDPITYGLNGFGGTTPTPFMYPGNPSNTQEWSECSLNNPPTDKKFVMSTGPFTLTPGSFKTLDFAVIWIRPQNVYPCPDFTTSIGAAADQVQLFFDTLQKFIPDDTLQVRINDLQNSDWKLFPNPFNDIIWIKSTNTEKPNGKLIVCNSLGQVLIQQKIGEPVTEIKTADLPSGIYTMMISADKNFVVKKLIKK